MATSTSGGAGDQTPGSSCPNVLHALLANEMADLDKSQHLARDASKIQMADYLRLMQDNQRLLDTTIAEDRAIRQQRHRFREAQLAQMTGLPVSSVPIDFGPPPGSEDMAISIDSPVTTNHYHPAPARSAKPAVPGWMTAALLGTSVLAAALGGSYLNALVNRSKDQPAATTTAPVNTTTGVGTTVELVPGEGTRQ